MKNFIKIDEQGNILEQGCTSLEELESGYIFVDSLPAGDGYEFNLETREYELKPDCLDDVKKCKKTQVQEKWQEIIDNGYEHNGETFDFDDTTLSIIGARLAHCNSTTNIGNAELTFYTSEKKAIAFADKASIVQFFEDFIKARNSVDQKRVSLKAEIDSSETVEKAEAVDITTGW